MDPNHCQVLHRIYIAAPYITFPTRQQEIEQTVSNQANILHNDWLIGELWDRVFWRKCTCYNWTRLYYESGSLLIYLLFHAILTIEHLPLIYWIMDDSPFIWLRNIHYQISATHFMSILCAHNPSLILKKLMMCVKEKISDMTTIWVISGQLRCDDMCKFLIWQDHFTIIKNKKNVKHFKIFWFVCW